MLADLNQSSVSFQKKIQHDTTLSRPAAGQYTPPQSTAPCHPISFLRKVPSSYPVAVVGTIWYHGYTETSVVQLTIFRYGDLITFCRRRVRHEPCWDDSLYQTTSQNLFSSLLCHWLSCEKFHPQKMACPMTVVPDRLEKFPCSTAKSQLATYKLILGRPKKLYILFVIYLNPAHTNITQLSTAKMSTINCQCWSNLHLVPQDMAVFRNILRYHPSQKQLFLPKKTRNGTPNQLEILMEIPET